MIPRPKYEMKTGTKSFDVWRKKDGSFIVLRDYDAKSFKFINLYNLLKRDIPKTEEVFFDELTRKFLINFDQLYFIDKEKIFVNKVIYRYDVTLAYKSTLLPLLSDSIYERVKDVEKEIFIKAVGYSAYHFDVIRKTDKKIFESKQNDRPDILKICVDFLGYLGRKLRDYGCIWQYVDCFAFEEIVDINNLIEMTNFYYKEFVKEKNLVLRREPNFKYHYLEEKIEQIKFIGKYILISLFDFFTMERKDYMM